MGIIAKDDQQLTLYYNSESSIGKQTHAYVKSSTKAIHTIDISKEPLTGTQWAELADKLNLDLSELVDTEHPKFIEIYGEQNVALEDTDWMKVLQEQPEVISWPIVVHGKKFMLVKNPSDIVKHIND